jgi:hypothetical protein
LDKEFILFCDESDRTGRFYSDFYGGALVGSSQYDRITKRLEDRKAELNLGKEVKWSRVSGNYLEKYKTLIDAFFEEVWAEHVKVRIMFRQNARQARNLSADQRERGYFLLYYQFIKHAFGLRYVPPIEGGTHLRLYFDEFPDKPEHAREFREFIKALDSQSDFKAAGLTIRTEDIQEIRSHEHVLLQCVDVILGSMTFRLNDKHKALLPGTRRRGKRTVAKEALYRHILAHLRTWKPRFNVGMSTAIDGTPTSTWSHPYRHWAFIPSDYIYDQSLTKR